jgi:hypothetical protein
VELGVTQSHADEAIAQTTDHWVAGRPLLVLESDDGDGFCLEYLLPTGERPGLGLKMMFGPSEPATIGEFTIYKSQAEFPATRPARKHAGTRRSKPVNQATTRPGG